jgi:hypothetical protein
MANWASVAQTPRSTNSPSSAGPGVTQNAAAGTDETTVEKKEK